MKRSNEFLLPHTLTDLQHQVMIGGLLGDSSLMLDGKFPRMKIDRQALDKPYIDWQYNIFKDLCKSGVREFQRFDKHYDKIHNYVSFRTRAVPAFLKYYHEWYPSEVRLVPDKLEFTPLILAVWFADDGCVINERNNLLTLKIATESFGKVGAEFLSSKLENRYGEKFPLYRKVKNKDQFFIKAGTYAARAFLKEIESHIIDMGMLRKYEVWKNIDLNKQIKIGSPVVFDDMIDNILLSGKDYYVNQIAKMIDLKATYVREYLTKFYTRGWLNRFEGIGHMKPYHYQLTDTGRNILKGK